MDVAERLEEFFRRLTAAKPCSSADDAFALVARLLIEVEDELSELPYDSNTPLNDGRMYPPQEDNRVHVPDRPDIRGYRTRRHRIYFSNSGAILVTTRERTWVFEKPDDRGAGLRL